MKLRSDRAIAVAIDQRVPTLAAQNQTRKMLIQATMMTGLAGFVDAVGYTAMGHLYLSFMSGNSTQFGMAVAGGDAHTIGRAGAVIATFLLGAFLGSMVHAAEGRVGMPLVLVCELVCLVLAWSLAGALGANVTLLFVALAMGMQNSLHKAVAGAVTGKSFVTGALFGTGDALARACRGRAHFAEAAANAVSWLAFVAGVTSGAFGVGAFGITSALQVAAGLVFVLLILTILWQE
jgi:uncharacterized membrane protein YoaK (UPF0700 family)